MKKLFSAFLCALILFLLLPTSAHADMGPKPSVRITLEGLDGRLCYGTLLSEHESTGPASAWRGVPGSAYHKGNFEYANLDEDIWQAFVDYQDSDGYYFLQWGWRVDETKALNWNYYPPERFKVALYFPETGEFCVSGIYERYAFRSCFAAEISGSTLSVYSNYNYAEQIPPLIARIVLTLLVELVLALLFGLRRKRQFLAITAVNVCTQILLNVILNYVAFRSGYFAFVFYYALLELLIFVVEAVLLCILLHRHDPKPGKGRIVLYALCANALSFMVGLALAKMLPGLF